MCVIHFIMEAANFQSLAPDEKFTNPVVDSAPSNGIWCSSEAEL